MRLAGYDYALSGAYFITIVAHDRGCLFGDLMEGVVRLNMAGIMIEKWWMEVDHKFPTIEIDEYVVMPNHFHGIVLIKDPIAAEPMRADRVVADLVGADLVGADLVGADLCVGPTYPGAHAGAPLQNPKLYDVIQWFKTMTNNEYIRGVKQLGWTPFRGKLWQRSFYDHIIRNEAALNRIRQYIIDNPIQWESDNENPARPQAL